ncbi:hypothetical protein [Nocardioides dongxiaopingii]|uniref:hypothetical protein n=1 Tax=Nocardioides dongxiaopingii TaxID=2576036 RepID=UPI0010C769B3|nr:hypothetical protein [Nocardioides dongxiaopingii]
MTTIKRRIAAASAPVLLALSLTACGGGSDAPTDASKDDFCGVINAEPGSDVDPEASPEDQAEAVTDQFKQLSEDLEETGTPEDIPDDAREGFEVIVEEFKDLDSDDVQKALEGDADDIAKVSEDDKKKVDKFDEWSSDYCG